MKQKENCYRLQIKNCLLLCAVVCNVSVILAGLYSLQWEIQCIIVQWPHEAAISDTLTVFLLRKRIAKGIVQPTECHVNTWHAAPNPLAVDSVAPPRVFSSNSMFQQSIYKMPRVCPEHTWNPQSMSPQTANPNMVPHAAAHAHGTPSPLLALKAVQVPSHSPDIAVTCQHHQFISEKPVQARTLA